MPFSDTWNSTYEGLPADNENINLGANRIRDFKVNTRQRANVDHSWGDSLDNGQHNQISFNLAAADPATSGTNGYLYTKAISGNTELFWKDSGGRVIQLTTVGAFDLKPFPSGTVMPFIQSAPPTGWNASASYADQMIRLVNDSSGGGTGGSWTITGTSVPTGLGSLAATTHDSGSTVSGTVAGHTLSVGELPSHTHNVVLFTLNSGNGSSQSGTTNGVFGDNVQTTDGGTGGGGSHNHGWSGSLSLSLSSSVTGAPSASFSNDASWRPAYANACVGVKA